MDKNEKFILGRGDVPVWVDGRKKSWLLLEMSTGHIVNTIKYLHVRGKQGLICNGGTLSWLDIFKKELKRRDEQNRRNKKSLS